MELGLILGFPKGEHSLLFPVDEIIFEYLESYHFEKFALGIFYGLYSQVATAQPIIEDEKRE